MRHDGKRTDGCGIFVPLSPEEMEQVKEHIRDQCPDMPLGKLGRTALFYYLHKQERLGYDAMIADILGA
jgi:hypothetical protein